MENDVRLLKCRAGDSDLYSGSLSKLEIEKSSIWKCFLAVLGNGESALSLIKTVEALKLPSFEPETLRATHSSPVDMPTISLIGCQTHY